MMTKNKQAWLILLLLIVTLSGCGAILGEEEKEKPERLTLADWPTPPPTPMPLTPTPFPKISPPPATPTQEAGETAVVSNVSTPVDETSGSSEASNPLDLLDDARQDLLARANNLVIEQYPTIGVAFSTVESAALRAGPSPSAAINTSLAQGELLGIIGKSNDGNWFYGFGTSLKRGWIAAAEVRLTGDLTKAPVLPADPVGAVLAQLGLDLAGATTSSQSPPATGNSTAAEAPQVDLAELTAVAKATVKTDGLNVRQGPGPGYNRLETLAKNETVNILALNKLQDWVLISADNLDLGWTSLENLTVEGSLAQAPTVVSALPEATPADGAIAPVSNIVAADGSVLAAGTVSQPTNTEPVTANSLGPITTGQLKRAEVEFRRGPGENFGVLDTLTASDTGITVLGRDSSGQWALVRLQIFTEDLGWLAASDLSLEGDLEKAPVVLTAWVESNQISVRRGPGIYEPEIGKLGLNTLVSVLGLDQQRSWALVQPLAGGGLGWTQVQLLTVNGSLADIPEAPPLVLPTEPAIAEQPLASPPIPPRPVSESQLVIQLASGSQIMVINPDGSGLRPLTNGIDPVLSPDGQTVAFTRWQGETGSLWLADVAGGNERSVAGFIKQAKGPEWSPDGSQIVLNFQQGGRLDPAQTCTDLTQDDPRRPPRGATDIETKFDDNGEPELCWVLPPDFFWQLKVINLADGQAQDWDGGTYAFRPAWDPSQPWRIVSDGGRGLLATDLNNPDYRETVTENVADSSPVFSPDGRYLAVTAGPPGGGSGHDIYRLNRDGSGRVRLTKTPFWLPVQPDSHGQLWNNVAPVWSPDGAQLAFLTDRTGRWEVWLMNADGSNQHPMFSTEINDQLPIRYDFNDERVISWR